MRECTPSDGNPAGCVDTRESVVQPKTKTSGAPASSKLPTTSDAPTRVALDRIATLAAALDYARRVLADRTRALAPDARAQLLGSVDRMWSAHTRTDENDANAPIIVIADAIDLAKQLPDDEAVNAFALVYDTAGLGDVDDEHTPAIVSAVRAARRLQGQRAKGAPSKWDALALLIEALGYGAYEPDALANMVKERRARREGKRTKARRKKPARERA